MVIVPRRQQPAAYQVEKFPFVRLEYCVCGRYTGRDYGVVVRHLRIVDKCSAEGTLACTRRKKLLVGSRDRADDFW